MMVDKSGVFDIIYLMTKAIAIDLKPTGIINAVAFYFFGFYFWA